jgi:hypothetical protein
MILPASSPGRVGTALRSIAAGVLLIAMALLVGCSSVSRGSVETIRLAFRRATVDPTPASVAASPYFQLQVNAPTGQAILILAKVEDGRLGWYGGQHDIVFTRDGLLVKTVGLSENLDSELSSDNSPFRQGLQHVGSTVEYTRRVDWSPGYRYGIELKVRLEPKGIETIDILGQARKLRRFDESVTVISTGQHMENRYWVDPADGFIWRSRQYVTPGFSLELIQLRPYRGAKS